MKLTKQLPVYIAKKFLKFIKSNILFINASRNEQKQPKHMAKSISLSIEIYRCAPLWKNILVLDLYELYNST